MQIDENKKEILQKGRNFLDKCLRAHNNKTYKYIKQTKITAIIPLYNCERTIESALHSIQYQNMSEIEILLIKIIKEKFPFYQFEQLNIKYNFCSFNYSKFLRKRILE